MTANTKDWRTGCLCQRPCPNCIDASKPKPPLRLDGDYEQWSARHDAGGAVNDEAKPEPVAEPPCDVCGALGKDGERPSCMWCQTLGYRCGPRKVREDEEGAKVVGRILPGGVWRRFSPPRGHRDS